MTGQTRSQMREMLERHGLSTRKALGQHFLADPNLIRKIVATAGVGPGDRVVEVGVGTGPLTAALADTGATVVGYEVDRRLEPLIAEVVGTRPNVEVRFADITDVDLVRELGPGPWVMVANLPYNVGTPLILDVLRHVPAVTRLVVMIQREVGERLVAEVGDAAYGLPSVVRALHGSGRIAFRVPPQVFVPPPNVESVVVVLDRTPAPAPVERAIELAAAGFGQRRKMLRRSLANVLDTPEATLETAGIAPTARPEELSAADFVRLAEVVGG